MKHYYERAKDAQVRYFRTRWSAAPLKLSSTTRAAPAICLFPHSLECGPIEAQRNIPLASMPHNFRTRWSAAPLKHRVRIVRGEEEAHFRTRWSAAPLKRVREQQE